MQENEVQEILVEWFENREYDVSEEIRGPAGNRVDIVARKEEEKWIVEVKGDYNDPAQYYVNFNTVVGQLLRSITSIQPQIHYAIAIPFSRTERGETASYRSILSQYSRSLAFELLKISLILVRDDRSIEVIEPHRVKEYLQTQIPTRSRQSRNQGRIDYWSWREPTNLQRSGYDEFWIQRLEDLTELIQEAHNNRESQELDISAITIYGNRNTWYGVVEVKDNVYRRGEMAHLRSLGRLVIEEQLTQSFSDTLFQFIISESLILQVFVLNS